MRGEAQVFDRVEIPLCPISQIDRLTLLVRQASRAFGDEFLCRAQGIVVEPRLGRGGVVAKEVDAAIVGGEGAVEVVRAAEVPKGARSPSCSSGGGPRVSGRRAGGLEI